MALPSGVVRRWSFRAPSGIIADDNQFAILLIHIEKTAVSGFLPFPSQQEKKEICIGPPTEGLSKPKSHCNNSALSAIIIVIIRFCQRSCLDLGRFHASLKGNLDSGPGCHDGVGKQKFPGHAGGKAGTGVGINSSLYVAAPGIVFQELATNGDSIFITNGHACL